MRPRTLAPVSALAALALLAAACTAGDTTVTVAQPEQTGISVSGTGSVTVVPDLAVLSLGVEVTRATIAEARSEAAEAMEAVRAALGRDGVEERDIATQYFNIFPQYSRPVPCVETRLVPAPARLAATEGAATEGPRGPARRSRRRVDALPAAAAADHRLQGQQPAHREGARPRPALRRAGRRDHRRRRRRARQQRLLQRRRAGAVPRRGA